MSMNSVEIGSRKYWPSINFPSFLGRASQKQAEQAPEKKEQVNREELIELFRDKLRPANCPYSSTKFEQVRSQKSLRKALYN